jgi:hypothetical protein
VRGILWSGIQCTLDDLGNLSIRDSSWPTCPVFVRQSFDTIVYEPAAPLAYRVLVDPEPLGYILAPQTLRAQQDHSAPIRQGAWRFMPAHLRFEEISILVAQNDEVRLPANHKTNSCSCDRS